MSRRLRSPIAQSCRRLATGRRELVAAPRRAGRGRLPLRDDEPVGLEVAEHAVDRRRVAVGLEQRPDAADEVVAVVGSLVEEQEQARSDEVSQVTGLHVAPPYVDEAPQGLAVALRRASHLVATINKVATALIGSG